MHLTLHSQHSATQQAGSEGYFTGEAEFVLVELTYFAYREIRARVTVSSFVPCTIILEFISQLALWRYSGSRHVECANGWNVSV